MCVRVCSQYKRYLMNRFERATNQMAITDQLQRLCVSRQFRPALRLIRTVSQSQPTCGQRSNQTRVGPHGHMHKHTCVKDIHTLNTLQENKNYEMETVSLPLFLCCFRRSQFSKGVRADNIQTNQSL